MLTPGSRGGHGLGDKSNWHDLDYNLFSQPLFGMPQGPLHA